jgi:putative hydrolase of the HAD superfamily
MASDVVLFDLGGVLVELGGVAMFGGWIGEQREEEIWRRWLACPWVRRYERGQCTTQEFGDGMVESWSLSLSPDEFLDHFRRWPRGLFPGARELLCDLEGAATRACFSNTNALHWNDQFRAFELDRLLEHTFLSFELGLVKPDREAFEHVVESLGVGPERVLFLDDNQLNVEGARAAGIDAVRVVGVEAARAELVRRGLLRR